MPRRRKSSQRDERGRRRYAHRSARSGRAREHDAVDPDPRRGHVEPGAAVDPAGSRPSDDERGAPFRASPRAGAGVHGRLLGPARLRSFPADARRPDRHQPRTHGRRHDLTSRSASNPLRRTDLRRRVLVRCDGRGVRNRTPAGPRRDVGDRRTGHRRCRRFQACLRLRARHRPDQRQPACDPPAGIHRAASTPEVRAVLHPRPLGGQLRWRHDQRDLRLAGPGIAREPGAFA